METASDEIKLQLIKDSLNELKMMIKMMMTTQTTIQAYANYVNDKVSDELLGDINKDEFKRVFSLAVESNQEILNNFVLAAHKISSVFNEDFISSLPTNNEEFNEMTKQLQLETKEYQNKYNQADQSNPPSGGCVEVIYHT